MFLFLLSLSIEKFLPIVRIAIIILVKRCFYKRTLSFHPLRRIEKWFEIIFKPLYAIQKKVLIVSDTIFHIVFNEKDSRIWQFNFRRHSSIAALVFIFISRVYAFRKIKNRLPWQATINPPSRFPFFRTSPLFIHLLLMDLFSWNFFRLRFRFVSAGRHEGKEIKTKVAAESRKVSIIRASINGDVDYSKMHYPKDNILNIPI